MQNYVCDVCGYVYNPTEGDPENGIQPGTPFKDLPDDWLCPLCGVGKEAFSAEQAWMPLHVLNCSLSIR